MNGKNSFADTQLLQVFARLADSFNSIAFAPGGRLIVSGSDDNTVRLWEADGGRLVRTLRGHVSDVRCVAFAPDERAVVSGSDDGTVRLWDVGSGRAVRTLAGHAGAVKSLAFAPGGRLLVSGSVGQKAIIWPLDSDGEPQVTRFSHPAHELVAVSFQRVGLVAEAIGTAPTRAPNIIVSAADLSAVPRGAGQAVSRYVSAKIVLVGESGVGKSCLALRLSEDRFDERLMSTHGMRIWTMPLEKLSPDLPSPAGEVREVFLWDLGGQDFYRLIHQLFIHDTTVAMILLDPTRGSRAYDDVREWNLRLEGRLRGRRVVKLLVGTKLDADSPQLNRADVEALGEAVARLISWDELSQTTRLGLFQRVRETVEEKRRSGQAVLLYSELLRLARLAAPDEFDPEVVGTVVAQLAGQGVIADTRLASGERALVLQIGYVEIYAGSLILLARNNPRGIPALELYEAVSGKSLPAIKAAERLDPLQERIVLECVIELMLEHGVCLKHEGLLIFPALFPAVGAEDAPHAAQTVSLYYDFSGAIDNVYSSLVVKLALSSKFGRVRLWKDRAEYEQAGRGICGLRKVDRAGGWAHLDLLFSEEVTPETKALFTVFVEDHVRSEGIRMTEVLEMTCACGYQFEEPLVREYISDGLTEIACPRPKCQRPNRISEGAAQARSGNPELEGQLVMLKTEVDRERERAVEESKRSFKRIEVFFSYAREDERLRDGLEKHLSLLRRQNVIEAWHDRQLVAGADWQSELDRRLDSASVILLLVSADFLASDYCYGVEMARALKRHESGQACVIPVILRAVDWADAPFSKLQALPTGAKPVTSWANLDEAFTTVAQGIRRAVEEILRPPAEAEAVPAQCAAFAHAHAPARQEPIRVLHLSELHMTSDADPLALLQPLAEDLEDERGGLGFERLDYLVVSGDLTDRAEPLEFEQAYQFISELIKRFRLSAERCVIVPGNHDLSWKQKVYDWQQEWEVDVGRLKAGRYLKQGDVYLVRDEEKYPARFENFGKFYHSLFQQPYPREAEAQALPFLFEQTGLQFLALNSAWEVDAFFRDRAAVNDRALAAGLLKAGEQLKQARECGRMAPDAAVLRLAVWHHPATGDEKIADDAFLERLRQTDFKLCLHGHVHEDRADLVGYLHPTRKVHITGAGSFGAVAADRPESTPRLYNLLEVERDHSLIRVHTRQMRKQGGAWEGWAAWPGERPSERRTFYEIRLRD